MTGSSFILKSEETFAKKNNSRYISTFYLLSARKVVKISLAKNCTFFVGGARAGKKGLKAH